MNYAPIRALAYLLVALVFSFFDMKYAALYLLGLGAAVMVMNEWFWVKREWDEKSGRANPCSQD